jgi:cytochrome c
MAAIAACGGGDGDGARDSTATPAAAAPAALPPARYALGRPATASEIAAWDIDVDTTGEGLPPGRGGYAAGARVYAARCASCHGARGEGRGAAFPRLVQPATLDSVTRDSFPFDRDPAIAKTVGNYWPYATTLYDYIAHAMPYDAPGSLTPNETYAVVAWILAENRVVPRTAVMDARTLPRVRMPARDRFVRDDRGGRTVR